MWRSLLWCGMIGAALGLIISIISATKSGPAPDGSTGVDIVSGVILGVVVGVFLLGIPACLWNIGRCLIAPKTTAPPPIPGTANVVGHDAVVGSSAAIPGAIAGGLGGFLIVAGFLAVVWFISIMTGSPWFTDIMNNGVMGWLAGFTIGGAILGALLGMVLGGVIGALFGGVRSAVRHS
jgi:hypothetical protein